MDLLRSVFRVTNVMLRGCGGVAAALLALEMTGGWAGAQPLVWDAAFSPDVVYGATREPLVRVAPADDGTCFITGNATHVAGRRVPGIVRLLADGVMDTAFAFDGEPLRPRDLVAPLDGGRFLVVHRADPTDGAGAPVVRRYHASGARDPAYPEVTISGGAVVCVEGARRMTDGAIVLYGRFSAVGGRALAGVARFTRTGELDAAFSPGVVIPQAAVDDVAAAPGGALIARVPAGGVRASIVRMDSGGRMDATFVPPPLALGPMLLVQRDGRVIFGGSRPVRLATDGAVDSEFRPLPTGALPMTSYSLEGAVELAGGDLVLEILAIGGWSVASTLQRTTSEGGVIGVWPGMGRLEGRTPAGRILTRVGGGIERSDRLGRLWEFLERAPGFFSYSDDAANLVSLGTDLGFPGSVSMVDVDVAGGVWLAGMFDWINGAARPGLARLTSGAQSTRPSCRR